MRNTVLAGLILAVCLLAACSGSSSSPDVERPSMVSDLVANAKLEDDCIAICRPTPNLEAAVSVSPEVVDHCNKILPCQAQGRARGPKPTRHQ